MRYRLYGLTFILSGLICFSSAQVTVESENLRYLVEDLLDNGIEPTSAGEWPAGKLCAGKKIVAEYHGSALSDVRLGLFHPEMVTGASVPALRFIERYWLGLLLQNKTGQRDRMRADFVTVRVDGQELVSSRYNVGEVLQQITQNTSFTIQSDTVAYRGIWNTGSTPGKIEIIFPKQYDLILGKDKKELSHLLVDELKEWKIPADGINTAQWDTTSFQLTSIQDLFFDPGGTYLIPEMKSGRYLQKKGEGYEYLFRERFRDESLLNLFSHADEMGWKGTINVEVKGYRLSQSFILQMDQLVSFMKNQYCKAYVGMEEDTPEAWSGTAIYVNAHLMYKHLLYFTFPRDAFKKEDTGIRAVLYPYIPINNLTDLYNERNEM